MKNANIFEMVLNINENYVRALQDGADKETQEALLEVCATAYKKLILDNGLGNEYKDYNEKKRLTARR